jgi:hypothetical protein
MCFESTLVTAAACTLVYSNMSMNVWQRRQNHKAPKKAKKQRCHCMLVYKETRKPNRSLAPASVPISLCCGMLDL